MAIAPAYSKTGRKGSRNKRLSFDLMSPGGQPRTLHTAWLRADGVVRDESLGIFDKMVRAGLRQVRISLERDAPAGTETLGKHNNDPDLCRRAFAIFRERYPQVDTIGTVVFGVPGDTPDDLNRLAVCQYSMGIDYLFIMPLTPNPGTAVAAEARAAGRIANLDSSSYNVHTPACTTDHLDLRRLESVYWRLLTGPSRARARPLVQKLFEDDRRKRRVHAALLWRGTRIAADSLMRAVLHRKDTRPTHYWRKASWYET